MDLHSWVIEESNQFPIIYLDFQVFISREQGFVYYRGKQRLSLVYRDIRTFFLGSDLRRSRKSRYWQRLKCSRGFAIKK